MNCVNEFSVSRNTMNYFLVEVLLLKIRVKLVLYESCVQHVI